MIIIHFCGRTVLFSAGGGGAAVAVEEFFALLVAVIAVKMAVAVVEVL